MLALRELPQLRHLESLQTEFPQLHIPHMQAYLALLKTATDFVKKIDTYLLTHGLQQNRFTILVVLYRDPESPMPAFQLADNIGVTRPTLTGLLDGLEKSKFIKRLADREDRRSTLVRITAPGQQFLRKILPGYYEVINEAMAGVSDRDAAQLLRILPKISV